MHFLGGRVLPEQLFSETGLPQGRSQGRRLPTLSDGDGDIMNHQAAVIGKPCDSCEPSPTDSSSTCSPECSSLGSLAETAIESVPSRESFSSRVKAPFAQLSAKLSRRDAGAVRAGGHTNPFAVGNYVDTEQEMDTGAGLGFGTTPKRMTTSAACCAAGEDVVVLDIFRSPLWSANGEEDVFKVEILRAATVGGLRQRIAELYGLPEAAQRLQRTPDFGGAPLRDTTPVTELVHKPVFLFPAGADLEEPIDGASSDFENAPCSRSQRRRCEDRGGEENERDALMRGMVESLQGVTYNVRVVLPEVASGTFSRCLTLDAMALVGDVLAMLEVEMTGHTAELSMMLVSNGQALPPSAPLHFAGVRDGDTLAVVLHGSGLPGPDVAAEDSDSEDDDPVLRWASA